MSLTELPADADQVVESVSLGEERFSLATVGYATKQLDGAELFFTDNVDTIHLTTKIATNAPEGTTREYRRYGGRETSRRLALTIVNYADIFVAGDEVFLFGIPSRGLAIQFALVLEYTYRYRFGKDVVIELSEPGTSAADDAALANQARLGTFWAELNNQLGATADTIETVAFGYPEELVAHWSEPPLAVVEHADWKGTVYEREGRSDLVMVLQSFQGYHAEGLAESIAKLLDDDNAGQKIRHIVVAGSAGFIGDDRPDHYAWHYPRLVGLDAERSIENAIAATLKDDSLALEGTHTSVPSVMLETVDVLRDLRRYGVQSIDMEFAYVADIVRRANEGRSDAGMTLSVALLITDYPWKALPGERLAVKDHQKKKWAEATYASDLGAALGICRTPCN